VTVRDVDALRRQAQWGAAPSHAEPR
jgi:hypothetical protein